MADNPNEDDLLTDKEIAISWLKACLPRNTGWILEEHYGEDSATIAAQHFADRKSKADIRKFINSQAMALEWRASQYYKDQSHAEPLAWKYDQRKEGKWPKPLQEKLDQEGIILRAYEERRRQYPKLSDQEFYEQTVKLAYTLALYTGKYELEKEAEKRKTENEREAKQMTQARPAIFDCLHQSQVDDGYLQCDLPPGYLEWVQQR